MTLIPLSAFPAINASLNATCGLLLISGFLLIRQKKVMAHTACMGAAFIVSILFLASYLYYHYHHGATPFPGRGWVRPVYFTILISHTILAVAIVPLALITLTRAIKKRWEKHVKIARITLPLWLYVSITGVVVYWMLYH